VEVAVDAIATRQPGPPQRVAPGGQQADYGPVIAAGTIAGQLDAGPGSDVCGHNAEAGGGAVDGVVGQGATIVLSEDQKVCGGQPPGHGGGERALTE
jgi:hypothetical protein